MPGFPLELEPAIMSVGSRHTWVATPSASTTAVKLRPCSPGCCLSMLECIRGTRAEIFLPMWDSSNGQPFLWGSTSRWLRCLKAASQSEAPPTYSPLPPLPSQGQTCSRSEGSPSWFPLISHEHFLNQSALLIPFRSLLPRRPQLIKLPL